MTLETYNERVYKLAERYRETGDNKDYDNLTMFQREYMNQFLEEYNKTIKGNRAKEICYELLEYAVKESISGSAIIYVDTKKIADKVDDIIWEEIGEYLLDSPEIYKTNDGYAIDCMFGGNYVPEWDGWLE